MSNWNSNKRGNIVADEDTMATSILGVYAGGDIVTGAAAVNLPWAWAKKAACINEYLKQNSKNQCCVTYAAY